jgi:MFS transporter, DHA2 family, multidrug resistance protein
MADNRTTPTLVVKHRGLIVFAVMMAAVIEILDMTIMNVALPHMMGSLGATSDQITWVLSAYIVSAAICMPLTGFLTALLGRKQLLQASVIGFLIASVLCGAATSLTQIVIFRILQGLFGAPLIPLSQAIMRDIYSKRDIGKAMAIWGIGIMAGPVLGPTLGGYITDALNWRWVFYINVPFCLLASVLIAVFIPKTERNPIPADWIGLILMVVGVGSLQTFLDRGNGEGWLESQSMMFLLLICIVSLSLFLIHSLRHPHSIVNLRLFKDRNFGASCLTLTLFGIAVFGTMPLTPLMLENLMNYPPNQAGLMMAPQGVASALTMAMMAKLMHRVDVRLLMTAGILCTAIAAYLFSQLTVVLSPIYVIIPGALLGTGMGLFFPPLSAIAFSTLPAAANNEAAGLFSFTRNLGSAIGISIAGTTLTREMQINWNQLGGHINPFNPNLSLWLQHAGMDLNAPTTPLHLANIVHQQAMMIALIDTYHMIAFIFLLALPALWFLKTDVMVHQDEKIVMH